ncbi:RmlC-like cupin domain-containing protein [Scheffersomyces coipomensis]|uniref:RmlC-like cupin domain-containing protein n=1 Tax=Scheffersomyces coipomensis TaxID=1788519 RepID=UPI00315C64A3
MSKGLTQLEFHIPGSEWIPVEGNAGIYNKILNEDKQSGRITLLQKYEPGAFTDNVAKHTFIEEVYIIEGELTDKGLKKTFEKGSYAFRHPGMIHGPYESRKGCLTFIIIDPSK